MATSGSPEALEVLSSATGESYRWVGRLAGGETGAHEVLGPNGRRLVVKWDTSPSSQAARRVGVGLTDRLRQEAGWPVPRQRTVDAHGYLFVLQALVAGSPVSRLTHVLVNELLVLHRQRLGLARADDSSWPESLIRTLVIGGDGYCLHEPLRGYDPRTKRLVEHVERIGREVDPDDLGGGDLVHWDLHPGNLLELDGHLAAVVDNDFVTTGDAAFDLITLAVSSLDIPCEAGVRRRLFELAVDPLDRSRRRAYLAHLLLRIIDWPIRRGRTEEVERWLGHADRLLPAAEADG